MVETELEKTLNQIRMTLSHRQSPPESLETTSKDSDVCPICQGTTWVYDPVTNFVAPCRCRDKTIMDRRLRFAALPEALKEMNLKTFRTSVYKRPESLETIQMACKAIKLYLEEFEAMHKDGMGLYLWSQTKGSGKTRMAASIANDLMRDKGKQVKFSTSLSIIQEIKKTWDDKEKRSESRLLDALATTDILIIDDFGTEQPTPWINDKFYQIINERYINRKITILTSNVALDCLKYDDRITDRLEERSYQIAFPEESVRKHIAERNSQEMIERLRMPEGR